MLAALILLNFYRTGTFGHAVCSRRGVSHGPEEAPVHSVTVAGFWIDRTPVTNREFRRFVEATGYVTVAEIPPDPKDYPRRVARATTSYGI